MVLGRMGELYGQELACSLAPMHVETHVRQTQTQVIISVDSKKSAFLKHAFREVTSGFFAKVPYQGCPLSPPQLSKNAKK